MSQNYWYKDAVIYQLHVRSFQDSNGDGIGDFRGLMQRLDHFTELGVTALWLLPFYVSPLRDEGYDIADYRRVNPSYGTVEDFREFLKQAHARGLKVITELVLNHTSDQNIWFQRARRAKPGSPERDFYVWDDKGDRYSEARIIFRDFETSNWTWDPVAGAYFWHRFYSHQPDLNFDNPVVHEEMLSVIDFWLDLGVDGVRLDAVPYLYERDGTNCENLKETHDFLKKLRAHVDSKYDNRMLLAEANQWPEDSAAYFGDGDECHMNFHFPLMPRLFMTMQMEDRFPLVDILNQTPAIHDSCQWGIFLRNHDELTLEMVTDEERDYMYKVYAQDARARINLGIRRRLAPLLSNNRKRIELINSLLLSMPGTPIIYYGDEIGMGDNFYLGDRDGVRTPMQWSSERNAGFSACNPHRLFLPVINDPEFHYATVNVEVQRANPSSLLGWMKRILQVRAEYKAFALGDLQFLPVENAKVVVYTRTYENETVLAIANLSRFTQYIELDLTAFAGLTPVEVFGKSNLPVIKQGHAPFTVGPHGFMWFALQAATPGDAAEQWEAPLLSIAPEWGDSLADALERKVLPKYLKFCRWFGGKGRKLREVRIVDSPPLTNTGVRCLVIEAIFVEGPSEKYLMPLVLLDQQQVLQMPATPHLNTLARLGETHVVQDALHSVGFQVSLFNTCLDVEAVEAPFQTIPGAAISTSREEITRLSAGPRVLSGEQSNTSISYGDTWLLKFFRKFEGGIHPEVEMTNYLMDQGFNVPAFGAALTLQAEGEESVIAMLGGYTQHQGDGFTYTLDALARYFDRVLDPQAGPGPLSFDDMLGGVYPDRAAQLGKITAEMHLALARAEDNPAFKPEPLTPFHGRAIYQAMRSNLTRVFRELTARVGGLPDDIQELARSVLARQSHIMALYAELLDGLLQSSLIRIHGDFHLGQALNTGHDFVIVDFEGEPRLSMNERRRKKPALRDVAGMIRSFDYAAVTALQKRDAAQYETLAPWAEKWSEHISKCYLNAYLDTAGDSVFIPANKDTAQMLLDVHILDKAVYEIGYELSYRPHMLSVPLKAVARLAS